MTARAEFDVGPLSWVKGEIDLAMQRGLESLRAFAGKPGEAAHIKLSQTHLHQAHGALQIVGLDGVTRLSEELEGLLADLEKGAVSAEPEVLELAERVYQAVLSYLDQLISGRPHQPLRLFPLYRELVKARPGARNTEAVDLYFPDLSFRPPKRETAGVALKPGEVEPYLREQRVRYQRGLLKWLKKDASGAQEMRSAVQAIESAQGPTSQRAFWWAALAFFDALAHEGVSVDADVKRLCNRVEQQIKRVMDGSPSVAERLMREVLYHVARAPHATDHVRLVQDVYHLADTLPPDEGVDIPLSAELPGVKSARDLLVQAKDAWNKFASGNAASLISFRDAASAMKECSHDLGNPEFAALTGETAALAAWLSSSKDKMSEAIALEVATALLLLENALTNFA
jgi:chemosensory pili system protein ChpA (sensor histidine kinase/response regulator)